MPASRWRRALAAGGRAAAALAAKGAGGAQCKLAPGPVNDLEAVLDARAGGLRLRGPVRRA
jgi:putative transposase